MKKLVLILSVVIVIILGITLYQVFSDDSSKIIELTLTSNGGTPY